MHSRQISRLIALMFIFSLIFAIDILLSGNISAAVYSFSNLLTVGFKKSRVFSIRVIEGVELSLKKESSQRVEISSHLFAEYTPVLGVRGYYILAAADAEEGDVAVDPDSKRLVGVVKSSNAEISWVESIFSPNMTIQVTLTSTDTEIDGELFAGNRVRIYESIDVTGFDVRVSDVFTCGTLLNNLNFGYIGTIAGREGIYYIVDSKFTAPSRLVIFPGY